MTLVQDYDYLPFGGKAHNLAKLTLNGFPVPAWCALDARCFQEVMKSLPDFNQIQSKAQRLSDCHEEELPELCQEIQSKILECPIPEYLQHEISNWVNTLNLTSLSLAVRSSALDEDAHDTSFAGMHDSYLGVSEALLHDHIKKVWASAFNLRAIRYRREHQLSLTDISMAVVIQQMITPKASGVLFTINPLNGHPQELMISSVYGLGEGLVSGALPADTHIYNKQGELLKQQLEIKSQQMIMRDDPHDLVETVAVNDSLQSQAALSPDVCQSMVRLGINVEQYYGRAQDIEFAIDHDDQIFLLQSRPITTITHRGPAAGFHQIWDNSNIIESYSGVTRPLTFSFIRHAYRNVYESFCEVMKVPPEEIQSSQSIYDNMLGYLNGHVYYNLMNWYRLIQLFPGYELNKRFMESMMGVGEKLNPEDKNTAESTLTRKLFKEWPRFVSLLLAMTWRFLMIQRMVDKFDAYFYTLYTPWHELNFDSMKAHELMQLYRQMEIKLLRRWRTPIINDFFVMIFYGTLKTLCKKWAGDQDGTLQNDLIVGEGDIESTRPTKLLLEIAGKIKADPLLQKQFLAHSPETLHQYILKEVQFVDLRQPIREYLTHYGDRCMSELKLESVTLSDDPSFMYRMLQNYVQMIELPHIENQNTAQIREAAETIVFSKLKGPKRLVFSWVLNAARRGVKNRENMRLARTRIYGLVRRIFRSVGRQWASEALLNHPEDIFFLTVDEVWDFVSGTAVSSDLKGLVRLRQQEQACFENAPEPADRFSTWGSPYHQNSFTQFIPTSEEELNEDPTQLQGTGCSPGEVNGLCKVILSPEADMKLNGEILVAGRTDPGWVVLYPSISGLLIERGSILSHSAIVAREMGIPTIVGIKDLTQRVESGQRVWMNGATGLVKLQLDDE